VLRAGEKFNVVVDVVAEFQGNSALQAHADRRLLVPRAQGRPLAFPPVTGDITEMTVAHPASFVTMWNSRGTLTVMPASTGTLAKSNCEVARYGSSLPPLTLVTVTFPLFRSVEVMFWEVVLPLSVCQVLVMIFLPSDVTLV